MDEHGLSPSDLPELGSPSIVREILEGKCDLTVKQIRAIAERFHVSPGVFI
jgi:HTH-type transcriptional regulator/antitoxin HigA